MADYFEERGFDANAQENRDEINRNDLVILLTDFNMFAETGIPNTVAPPASKKAVKDLPESKIQEGEGGQCLVCLKEYEKDELVRRLPCKHSFHSSCILAWLEKTNSCPLCRYELPTDNPLYEAYRKEKIRAKERVADIENLHNSMFT